MMMTTRSDLIEAGLAHEEAEVDRVDVRQIERRRVLVDGFVRLDDQSGSVERRHHRRQGNHHHQQHQLRHRHRHRCPAMH